MSKNGWYRLGSVGTDDGLLAISSPSAIEHYWTRRQEASYAGTIRIGGQHAADLVPALQARGYTVEPLPRWGWFRCHFEDVRPQGQAKLVEHLAILAEVAREVGAAVATEPEYPAWTRFQAGEAADAPLGAAGLTHPLGPIGLAVRTGGDGAFPVWGWFEDGELLQVRIVFDGQEPGKE